MRFLHLLLSPLLAVVAAACDNVVRISHQGQFSPYSDWLIAEMARDGELPLRLHGEPLPGSIDPRDIAAAIRPPSWLPQGTHFTTTPSSVARNFAIVLVFNPVFRDSGMDVVCAAAAAAPQTLPADGRKLRVAANVCYEGRSISWLYAEGPAPAALDDPKFRKLTDQIVMSLLPRIPRQEGR